MLTKYVLPNLWILRNVSASSNKPPVLVELAVTLIQKNNAETINAVPVVLPEVVIVRAVQMS